MKSYRFIITLLVISVMAVPVLAEDTEDEFKQDTLFKSGKVKHGGFGGPVLKVSSIKDSGRVLVGGRGAWLINHSWTNY